MLMKTRANLLPAIELRLRERHSYKVPELVAVPIGDGAQPYLDGLLPRVMIPRRLLENHGSWLIGK